MTYYSHVIQALMYDGANHTEMTTAASAYYTHSNFTSPIAFVSAYPSSGNTITIVTDQYQFIMQPGQWLVQDKDVIYSTNNTPHFEAFYRLPEGPTISVGYETTPNLSAGASATVNVPMVPALPDAGYAIAVSLAGSSQLLGALAILSSTVAGSAQVDVVVQNTDGLLTLGGATVLVTALHNG